MDSAPVEEMGPAETGLENTRTQLQETDRIDLAEHEDGLERSSCSYNNSSDLPVLMLKSKALLKDNFLGTSNEGTRLLPAALDATHGRHGTSLGLLGMQVANSRTESLEPDDLLDTAIMEWQALCEGVSARCDDLSDEG